MLTPVTGPPPAPRGVARVVAAFVLPYLLLGLVWVFANPVMAAPDEDAHLVKALGIARLDIGAPGPPAAPGAKPSTVRNASITRVVDIPARLSPQGYACFAFRADVTAACQPVAAVRASGDLATRTTLGAYPPFVYLPLGLVATLGSDPVGAVRLGRLLVLAFSVALLWLACDHLVRWLGPRCLLGVAAMATPMVVFCTGILNTSALEILGALGIAAVVAVFARRPDSLAAPRTLGVVLVSGTALVLSRQLGVVTMAVLTLLLLGLGGWREVWAGLRDRRPMTWAAVAVPALCTVAVAVGELGWDHPVLLGPWVSGDSVRGFLGQLPQLVGEGVGRFGWLDVRPPDGVNLVWFAVVAVLVVTALVVGDGRDRAVLAAMLGAALVVSYVTYARIFFPVGAGLQGRHVLPILAIVPVWSGVVVAQRLPAAALRRVVRPAALALPLVVLAGLYLNSQRYAVGLDPSSGLRWFVPDAQWSPPLGWPPWLALGALGCLALGVTWVWVISASPTADTPVGATRE